MDVEFAVPPLCVREYVHRCIFDRLIDWEATMDVEVIDSMRPGQCTARTVTDDQPWYGQVTVCRLADGRYRAVVSIGMTVITRAVGSTDHVVDILGRAQMDAPMLTASDH